MEQWRLGEATTLKCPNCGEQFDVAEMIQNATEDIYSYACPHCKAELLDISKR